MADDVPIPYALRAFIGALALSKTSSTSAAGLHSLQGGLTENDVDVRDVINEIVDAIDAGVGIQIPSAAQGDIIYFDGTSWVRMPAGTSGQVLQTAGASAAPAWADRITQWLPRGPGSIACPDAPWVCGQINQNGGATTVVLPTATNQRIEIVDALGLAATYNITIDPPGSVTINGASTYVISANYGSVVLQAAFGNWVIVAKN